MGVLDLIDPLTEDVDLDDPGLSDALFVDDPVPAAPTSAPNRVTFFVPTFETRLSMGDESERWSSSAGIVGMTGPRVLFDAQLDAAARTAVHVGESLSQGFVGGTPGYRMRTLERAAHHADGQIYITSSEGDVILHAAHGHAAMQSDDGDVECSGRDVTLQAGKQVLLHASAFTPFDASYAKPWELRAAPSALARNMTLAGVDVLQSLAAFHALPRAVVGRTMIPGQERDERTWQTAALDISKIVVGAAGPLECFKTTSLVAKKNVGMFSITSSVLASTLTSAVIGGAQATVVGTEATVAALGYSTVWSGLVSALGGVQETVIASRDKGTIITSKRGTSVHAGFAARIAAQHVQLNAEGDAGVYGGTVFVGAPASGGRGFWADASQAWLGKVTEGTYDALQPDASAPHVCVTSDKVELVAGDAMLVVDDAPELSFGKNAYLRLGTELTAHGKSVAEFKCDVERVELELEELRKALASDDPNALIDFLESGSAPPVREISA